MANLVQDEAEMGRRRALGQKIREARLAKQWRRQDLADALGVRLAYAGQYELGTKPVDHATRAIIATALGVDPEQLGPPARPVIRNRARGVGLAGV